MSKVPSNDSGQAPRASRGRPVDLARCNRIIDVARAHFGAHGLQQANVESIALDACVSKMTIYKHFGSKEGLFESVVRDRTGQVIGAMASVGLLDPAQPADALRRVGAQFLALSREAGTLGHFRSMYGAAGTQSAACQAFYRQGPARLVSDLADYLHRAHQAGALHAPQPRLAADLFLAMFLGEGHIRGLLKLEEPNTQDNEALLQEAVRVFLCAYAAPG